MGVTMREQLPVSEMKEMVAALQAALDDNQRLRERAALLAKAFSLVSAGLPLDQLQTEEHV